MYKKYFGLKMSPFSIAPDPRFLYLSGQHREALAHVLHGIRSDGGFVLLTGEIGTGKTTTCRCIIQTLEKHIVVAFIIHPALSVAELLAAICDEFGIAYPKKTTRKDLVDRINDFLLDLHAKRKRAILIIDEAQNLSHDVLEQIRLLTNLETNERKLLQIVLIGQPELRDKLAGPELRQLDQRIVARCHLVALSKTDVFLYVNHRLRVAGGRSELFSKDALNSLYFYSSGIPRLINVICDRALLGAFVRQKQIVNRATLIQAANEVLGGRLPGTERRRKALMTAAVLICIWLGLMFYFFNGFESRETGRGPGLLRPLPAMPQAPRESLSGIEPTGPDMKQPIAVSDRLPPTPQPPETGISGPERNNPDGVQQGGQQQETEQQKPHESIQQ